MGTSCGLMQNQDRLQLRPLNTFFTPGCGLMQNQDRLQRLKQKRIIQISCGLMQNQDRLQLQEEMSKAWSVVV